MPREDQEAVLAFLKGRGKAAVWAPTGAGKTAIAAHWADEHLNDRFSVGRLLIVAPKLVAGSVWAAAAGGWEHLRRVVRGARLLTAADFGLSTKALVTGDADEWVAWLRDLDPVTKAFCQVKLGGLGFADKRATKKHLQSLRERVHIVSWDFFPWLAEAYGTNWPYQGVIFDESSFLRDQGSGRSVAARRCVHKRGMSHVLQLGASPNDNADEAVYAQLDLLQRGVLGDTLTDFRDTFCVPDTKDWSTGRVYRWKVAAPMRAEFERRCSTLAISVPDRLGIEVLRVPHWVELAEQQAQAYDAIDQDMVWRDVTCGSAAVKHAKLREICTGFVYTDSGEALWLSRQKIDMLLELLETIERPLLLAYEWIDEQREVARALGKHFRDVRQAGAIDAFTRGKIKVLGLHPKSAGHGLDGLQSVTNHLVWTTVPEDLEMFNQVNGRLKRPGQDAPTVMSHALVARGRREQEIWDEVLTGKSSRAQLLHRATMPGMALLA